MNDQTENQVIRRGVCAAGILGVRPMSNSMNLAGDAYRIADQATASPSQLSEILIEAVIRLCSQACDAIDDGMVGRAGECMEKALACLSRMQPICQNISPGRSQKIIKLLNSINAQINEAMRYQRSETLTRIISLLQNNRELWQEAGGKMNNTNHEKSWIA